MIPGWKFPPPAKRSGNGGRTILVMEDEEFVRRAICKILFAAGYRTLAARSVMQARRMVSSPNVHVALLLGDVILPGERGDNFAVDLRPLNRNLRIILVSGYPDNVATRDRINRSRAWFLPKPFSADVLLRAVGRALKGPALRAHLRRG